MPAILRIDVDRAYENRILHYVRVNQELFLGIDSPGYLEPCKKLVDNLNERGIKASLFFQQRGCTPSNPASDIRYAQSDCRLIKTKVPNKEFAQELMKHGHSIGLHAVHTKDYNDFSRDLGKISRRFDGKVYGFTKHGSGKFKLSRRHDPNYDPNKFIDYAKQSNLRYFIGNRENPDEKEKMANDFEPKGKQRDVFGDGKASARIVKIVKEMGD